MDQGIGQALGGNRLSGVVVISAFYEVPPGRVYLDFPPGDELQGILCAVAHVVSDTRFEPHLDIPAWQGAQNDPYRHILDDRVAEGPSLERCLCNVSIDMVDVETGDVIRGVRWGKAWRSCFLILAPRASKRCSLSPTSTGWP